MSLFDEEERWRINAFDWCGEQAGFGSITSAGGFDAVIGNPPYVRMEAFKDQKIYLRQHYVSHDERSDLYVYFIERELQLLRPGGRFGMIVSNKFLRANYGRKIRSYVAAVANVERIVDLAGLRVFGRPTVRTIVLVAEKGPAKTATRYSPPPSKEQFEEVQEGRASLVDIADASAYDLAEGSLSAKAWILMGRRHAELMEHLGREGIPLVEFIGSKICRGIVSGLNNAFVISGDTRRGILAGNICMGIKSGLTEAFVISDETRRRILSRNKRAAGVIRPFLQGRYIRRYQIEPSDEYLIYTHHGIDMTPYPAILRHLEPFKEKLKRRATKQKWYELQQPQYAYVDYMTKPKIVFPDIATGCRFALDRDGYFGTNTVYFLPTDDLRLLGLLNSKLAFFYFKQTCAALEGPDEAYLRFFGQYMENFPVRLPSPKDKRHARMIRLVEERLLLQQELKKPSKTHGTTMTERMISGHDHLIDELVYDLYELTDEEIKIVEEPAD